MLRPEYIQQLESLIGAETPDFIAALEQPPVVSLRLHPQKMQTPEPNENLIAIPWTKQGFYLRERPFFTADPRLHAGAYYVQEASSMFLETVVNQCVAKEEPLFALDMCAAPGGKTTHLSSLLPEGSWLVANEPVGQRTSILLENVQKWGQGNTTIIQNEPKDIAKALPEAFDLVLVDAPCSGEGLFRKMPQIAQEWSLRQVEGCALRQRPILEAAWAALREGGLLIYSTCTFNRQENEENLLWLLETQEARCLRLQVPEAWGISESEEKEIFTYKFYPHKTAGEGFSVAILQKTSETNYNKRQPKKAADSPKGWNWAAEAVHAPYTQALGLKKEDFAFWLSPNNELVVIPQRWQHQIAHIYRALRVHYAGLVLGEIIKKDFKPSPALALWQGLKDPSLLGLGLLELDYEATIQLLCQQPLVPPADTPDGWLLVRYEGFALGWVKKVSNRLNNYFPKEWKIVSSPDKMMQERDSLMKLAFEHR